VPLAGIRILEVGHVLAGPYATMVLADLGAEVTKVEPPGGDISRQVSDSYFASLNRNKRSVRLDLSTEAGQAKLHELVATAHALLTNLKPSAIRGLGLTYDALRSWNERIVCVALTGYGLDGGDDPAFDYLIQAAAGVASLTGDPDGPPVLPGYSSVDNSSGLTAALGLLALIVSGGAHSTYVPAQLFPTADGYLALFITHDRFWQVFVAEAGLTDVDGFTTMADRTTRRAEVLAVVTKALATDTAAHWETRLRALGVPARSVLNLPEALAQASHLIAAVGGYRLVGNAIKIAGYEPEYRKPPALGEHGGTQ
jgi:crotonobetainyl-CoA:carnitine CoA-transferase CaiB-like acyl-CoA transferase